MNDAKHSACAPLRAEKVVTDPVHHSSDESVTQTPDQELQQAVERVGNDPESAAEVAAKLGIGQGVTGEQFEVDARRATEHLKAAAKIVAALEDVPAGTKGTRYALQLGNDLQFWSQGGATCNPGLAYTTEALDEAQGIADVLNRQLPPLVPHRWSPQTFVPEPIRPPNDTPFTVKIGEQKFDYLPGHFVSLELAAERPEYFRKWSSEGSFNRGAAINMGLALQQFHEVVDEGEEKVELMTEASFSPMFQHLVAHAMKHQLVDPGSDFFELRSFAVTMFQAGVQFAGAQKRARKGGAR